MHAVIEHLAFGRRVPIRARTDRTGKQRGGDRGGVVVDAAAAADTDSTGLTD